MAYKWGLQANLPSTHPYAPTKFTNGPVGFTPTSLTPDLWLDAGDATTICPPVTQWNDKSGNGNTFTNVSVIAPPARQLTAFNGRPTVSFTRLLGGTGPSGAATALQRNAPTLPNLGTSQSIFIVGVRTGSETNFARYFSVTDGTGNRDDSGGTVSGGQYCLTTGPSAGNGQFVRYNAAISAPGSTVGARFIGAFYVNSGQGAQVIQNNSAATFLNGSSFGSNTVGTNTLAGFYVGTALSGAQIRLGALTSTNPSAGNQFAPDGGNDTAQADICEVMIFTGILSKVQAQQVEGYLADKWGLRESLPSNHPYRTIAGPVVRPFLRTFVPTDIDGCQIWMDPADSSTVTVTSGTVRTIRDKSGNGNDMANASSTFTYASTLNGLPVLLAPTAGGNNGLTSPNITRDPLNHTYFIVIKYANTGTSPARFLNYSSEFFGHSGTGASANNFYLENNNNVSGGATAYNFYTVPIGSNDAFFGGNTFICCVVRAGTSNIITTNGFTGSASQGGGNSTANTASGFGYSLTGGTQDAVYGDVIVYNAALTTQQRQRVEGYLAWKWGLRTGGASFYNGSVPLGVPTSHPLYQFPTATTTTPFYAAWDPRMIGNMGLWYDASDASTISGFGTSAFVWRDKSGLTTASRTNQGGVGTTQGTITAAVVSGSNTVYTVSGGTSNPYYANNAVIISGITGISNSGFNGSGTIVSVTAPVSSSFTVTVNIPSVGTATGFSSSSKIIPDTYPAVSVASVNGLNALSIQDNSSAVGFTPLPLNQFSVFMVTGGRGGITDFNGYVNLNMTVQSSTTVNVSANGSAGNSFTVAAGILTNPVLLELTSPGVSSTGTLYVNGVSAGTFATAATSNAGLPVLSRDVVGGGSAILYCEVIAYTSLLTTTQRQLVEGYLAWKWGLQGRLDAAHPYKTAGPLAPSII